MGLLAYNPIISQGASVHGGYVELVMFRIPEYLTYRLVLFWNRLCNNENEA